MNNNQKTILIELELEISKKRDIMIKTGNKYGIKHPRTLKCSKELDVLLNKYQRLANDKSI